MTNTKISLKVKCSICGKETELIGKNAELLNEIGSIIKKYELNAESYLHFLDVMCGKCLDSDEHSFIFDNSFLQRIKDIIIDYKNDMSEIEKIKSVNKDLNKELYELSLKIKEIETKAGNNKDRINKLWNNVYDYMNRIETSTGYRNVEIWRSLLET